MAPSSDSLAPARLLCGDDPPAFFEARRRGRSSFVIIVDHASARIPRQLGDLGLPPDQRARHIAWDIGALSVAQLLSASLDAALVAQNYSRLVIDCNRPLESAGSIPLISDRVIIPGNQALTAVQIASRREEIFDPYHRHISKLLDERASQGRATILLALHSMTPVLDGVARAMDGAVMYHRDRRFASQLLSMLRREPAVVIGDNQPYAVSDQSDYSIPNHGEARGLPHVGFEMRQDQIEDEGGQARWADRLNQALQDAESLYWSTAPRGR